MLVLSLILVLHSSWMNCVLHQVLVKVADPVFMGFVAERKVDCANKVVLRVSRRSRFAGSAG